GSYGQTVQQPATSLHVLQGEYLQLNCTQSGADYLYWYVQYPDKPMEMLVNNLGQKENKEFKVKQEGRDSSFHVSKQQAEMTDTGMYFCAASDTVPQSDLSPVTKPPTFYLTKAG
ncbi:hypothetical protein GDO86_001609, partial [Hymenochirus boettgeri]